ncbi:MAG: hypothetical protein JWM12_3225 [Ilumatobacteraceae bacterium]|nr:hypothetical protein [Ilumatobacteraceae bacterium]
MRLLVGLVVTASLTLSATRPIVPSVRIENSPAALVHLPGDDNLFSNYDYRQDGQGAVDWPVTFVFTGNATIARIKDALCHATATPWTYCDTGSTMYLEARAAGPGAASAGFVRDGGVKRFGENCSTSDFTAHMRIYAPPAGNDRDEGRRSFTSAAYGSVVVATTHLDFEDHAGCGGRIHGYTDVAEHWFITAMRTVPGWDVRPDSLDLQNANETYVVLRQLSGAEVPHVYGNDRLATRVIVP